MQQQIEQDDVRVVMDETWYTRSGAIKLMDIKSTTLSKEIREKRITVFKHPNGDLFSREAIQAWIQRWTSDSDVKNY